jgi:hypothetical protein
MTRFSRFDEKDLDRLFSGISPEGPLDDLTAFLRGVRASCAQSPTEDVVGQHLASISETIGRSETRPPVDRSFMTTRAPLWRRAVNNTVSAALKVGAGVVAASMSMVGLAYAGVDLPRQAPAHALEAVTGLELPNQDPETVDEVEIDRSVSGDVRAVIESRESYATGCEFGRAVAAAATQNSQGQGDPQAKDCHSDGATAAPWRGAASGTAKSADGKANASGARSGNATSGRERASERSKGASEARSGKAAPARARASERSKEASGARSGNAASGRERASKRSKEASGARGNAVVRRPGPGDSSAAAGGTASNAPGGRSTP